MRTNPGIAILHRAWRAIPHAWRRRALDRAALWLAPGRERHPLEGEGWIVVGALSASTGLGEAARLAVQALVSLGRRVSVYDVSAAFRQDISVEPPALEPAEAGPGTVLMFVTPPLCALARAGLSGCAVEAVPDRCPGSVRRKRPRRMILSGMSATFRNQGGNQSSDDGTGLLDASPPRGITSELIGP